MMDPTTSSSTPVANRASSCSSSNNNSQSNSGSTKSAWEDGVDVLTSVLIDHAATLTATQREGLTKLKRLLLTSGIHDKTSFLPPALLLSSQRSPATPSPTKRSSSTTTITETTESSVTDTASGCTDTETADAASQEFILANFAGVQRRTDARQRLRNVIRAQTFVGRLQRLQKANSSRSMGSNGESDDSAGNNEFATFLPSGFLALTPQQQERAAHLLSWQKLSQWNYNVFDLQPIVGDSVLVYMGWAILGAPYAQQAMQAHLAGTSATAPQLSNQSQQQQQQQGYWFLERYNISPRTLVEFLRRVQDEYRLNVPYHNRYHASDVLQTLHALFQMMHFDLSNNLNSKQAVDPIQIFSVLLSAVLHDMGHEGFNNNFQINSKSDLALLYNDNSVLENMHAAKGFELLMGKKKTPEMDILAKFSQEQASAVRRLVIQTVLQTDMTRHFENINHIKGMVALGDDGEISNSNDNGDTNDNNDNERQGRALSLMKGENAVGFLSFLLHCADISNCAKPAPIFEQWTDRCLEEFFLQGDREQELGLPVSPLCDRASTRRPDSQIGFIQYVILPTFELLGKIIPDVATMVVPIIHNNLQFWKKEQKRLLAEKNEKESGSCLDGSSSGRPNECGEDAAPSPGLNKGDSNKGNESKGLVASDESPPEKKFKPSPS